MTPTNNIISIKSRRMKLIGACVRYGRNAYRFWWGNLKEMDHLEELGVYRIMSAYVFKKVG